MLPRGPIKSLTLAVLCLAVAAPALAGFSGTEVFLPAVGAASGVPPSLRDQSSTVMSLWRPSCPESKAPNETTSMENSLTTKSIPRSPPNA